MARLQRREHGAGNVENQRTQIPYGRVRRESVAPSLGLNYGPVLNDDGEEMNILRQNNLRARQKQSGERVLWVRENCSPMTDASLIDDVITITYLTFVKVRYQETADACFPYLRSLSSRRS